MATRVGGGICRSISASVSCTTCRISARCVSAALMRDITLSPKRACGLKQVSRAMILPLHNAAATSVVVPMSMPMTTLSCTGIGSRFCQASENWPSSLGMQEVDGISTTPASESSRVRQASASAGDATSTPFSSQRPESRRTLQRPQVPRPLQRMSSGTPHLRSCSASTVVLSCISRRMDAL